ncbi:hypothetical protein ACXX9E_28870 [Pseudomonas sp. GNP014]
MLKLRNDVQMAEGHCCADAEVARNRLHCHGGVAGLVGFVDGTFGLLEQASRLSGRSGWLSEEQADGQVLFQQSDGPQPAGDIQAPAAAENEPVETTQTKVFHGGETVHRTCASSKLSKPDRQ